MSQGLFDVERIGHTTVVHFGAASFTEPGVGDLAPALLRLADRRGLRLDLARVEYLGAAGLGVLLRLRRRVQAAGGWLALENVSPRLREVFDVTGLTRLFPILAAAPSAGRRVPDGWQMLARPHILPVYTGQGAGV
jgi:anti-sigma B factor antagonist